MPFYEIQLPTNYDYGSKTGPGASTKIFMAKSGYETRFSRWGTTRARYTIDYKIRAPSDVATLKAFYMCVAGMAGGFRFQDWYDFTSAATGIVTPQITDQPLVQDSNGNWRLVKVYGSTNRFIIKPQTGTVLLQIHGNVQSITYGTTPAGGSHQAAVDPTTGIVVASDLILTGGVTSAGFNYDTPVRFDSPLDLLMPDYNAQSAVEIKLRELLFRT